MKKTLCMLLALALALALVGCGAQKTVPDASSSVPSGEESVTPEDTSSVEDDRPVSPDVSKEETPDPTVDDPIQVTLAEESGENLADDGTVLLEWQYQIPTVSVPTNREAEKLIQADLDLLVEDFQDFIATQTQAAASAYESGEGWTSEHYLAQLNITVARCDGQVISLVLDDIGYSGGAHGWDNRYARNYDAMTGERITFDNLGGDSFVDFCRTNLLAQIEAKIQESGDSSPFFSDYQNSIGNILQDGTETNEYGPVEATFYFNEEGLVFISGEYVLQPYAAGILEFSIPYADLSGVMGDGYLL